MSTTTNITPAQIVAHRKLRKATGMLGCLLTGVEDMPLHSMRGICWKVDAKGRYADHPEYDPKDPGCFCFDCRGIFDPEGEVDAELVNARHTRACWVYENLLPAEERIAKAPQAKREPNPAIDNVMLAPPPSPELQAVN